MCNFSRGCKSLMRWGNACKHYPPVGGKVVWKGKTFIHQLAAERSRWSRVDWWEVAEVIVVVSKEPMNAREVSSAGWRKGLNVGLSRIWHGGPNFEFASLILNKDRGVIGVKSDSTDIRRTIVYESRIRQLADGVRGPPWGVYTLGRSDRLQACVRVFQVLKPLSVLSFAAIVKFRFCVGLCLSSFEIFGLHVDLYELKMCLYPTLIIFPLYLFLVLCFSLLLVSNYHWLLLFSQSDFQVHALRCQQRLRLV